MPDDEGMAAAPEAPEQEAPSDADNEEPSVFLSQEQLGGKKVKAGDTITLVVRDVDPETGDVQADLSDENEQPGGEEPSYASDFDKAMPPGQEGE